MNEIDYQRDIVINANDRFKPAPSFVPKIDELISKLVGKTIYMHDPRLMRLLVKWKKGKSQNSMIADNFLDDPNKIKELKETFNVPL